MAYYPVPPIHERINIARQQILHFINMHELYHTFLSVCTFAYTFIIALVIHTFLPTTIPFITEICIHVILSIILLGIFITYLDEYKRSKIKYHVQCNLDDLNQYKPDHERYYFICKLSNFGKSDKSFDWNNILIYPDLSNEVLDQHQHQHQHIPFILQICEAQKCIQAFAIVQIPPTLKIRQ